MDIASVIGLVAGMAFLLITIFLSGDLMSYIDIPSIMCTFGGTISGTLLGYPLNKVLTAFKSFTNILKGYELNPSEVIEQIINLANIARKEGILALEEAAQSMDDKFLQKGILLIVDGTDPELVRSILETELSYIAGRHGENQATWEFIASMGPAWGMLGTLIGLINMLRNLDDMASLGPNMAVALVTTFYGSLIANYFALPVANKLKVLSGDEILMKEVMIEGMLSIQAGENPRIIEEKLKAFLSPALRGGVGNDTTSKELGE